jgi:hypothetical protein
MPKNEEIAEEFAEGKTKGKSKHLFIEGDIIYSYGHHFPIAKRTGEHEAEFTEAGYSVTTSHHKNLVRKALLSKGFHLKKMKDVS